MAHFPAHLPADEAREINPLLTRLLAAGFHIRVHNHVEFATSYTRDRAEIQRETAATGMTTYILGTPSTSQPGKFKRHGTVLLVHGNGEDVISDASAPDDAMLDTLESIVWPKA